VTAEWRWPPPTDVSFFDVPFDEDMKVVRAVLKNSMPRFLAAEKGNSAPISTGYRVSVTDSAHR
jgi:hypothetical protein